MRAEQLKPDPFRLVSGPWCTFFARNAGAGQIEDALVIARNLGVIETSGVDMQLDWSLPAVPGTLGVNWLVSSGSDSVSRT